MSFVARFSPAGNSQSAANTEDRRDELSLGDSRSGELRRLSSLAQLAQLRLSEQESYSIVGRIRLDRRDELKGELASRFGRVDRDATDADLCLLAYAAWGEGALDHLHGDFAFALWDERSRKLFCARDRLGIRTLPYLEKAGTCWVSDSLRDLVAESGYESQALDRVWISDFLKIGFCDDPSRTVYAEVRRLLPGHALAITPGGSQLRCYWRLELAEPIFLKSPGDYGERFQALLGDSIRDRLPDGKLGIMMSGGLDSSTLAAKAVELTGSPARVTARSWLVSPEEDTESWASRLVAQHLGIHQDVIDSDLLHYDPNWRERPAQGAEPGWGGVYPQDRLADMHAMEQQATVWFYGEGPDNALTFEWRAYLKWLARRGMWAQLSKAVVTYLGTKSLKEWGTTLGVWSGRKRDLWPSPDLDWIRDPGLPPAPVGHDADSWRPNALKSFRGAQWPYFLESLDDEYASTEIDWRHPFLDLRVLDFMLRTPPIPWGRRKRLIRSAMKGHLPPEILTRDKSPLHRDLLADLLRECPPAMPEKGARIEDYVEIERLPEDLAGFDDPYALLRVSILDHWLNTRHG